MYRGKYHNTDVAIKVLRRGNFHQAIDLQQPEIAILSNLRHPRILLLLGVVPDLDSSYAAAIGLVTEYMTRGSLYGVLHSSTSPIKYRITALSTKLRVLKDIVDGMIFLHARNVIHRNLKSLNVLLDEDGRAKVCDFGVSQMLYHGSTHVSGGAGTPAWQAPESFRKGNAVRASSDVYSFGVIVWEVMTGNVPWESYDAMQIMTAVVVDKERLPLPQSSIACPVEVINIIRNCFAEPTDRPNFPTILSVLETVLDRTVQREQDHIPEDFICAITYELMEDPVICSDGHTYERLAIIEWLQNHNTSPRTNEILPDRNIIPNIALRNAIRQFLEQLK